MRKSKEVKVGIGFATGRKNFQQVLKSYIYNFVESGLVNNESISLNIFVAYDTSYSKTKKTDFIKIPADLLAYIDSTTFIGKKDIENEIDALVEDRIIDLKMAQRIFRKGYSSQRNAVLYSAIKNNIDYLLFLDDDEYPVAVTNTRDSAIWGGQHVLGTHLKYIFLADITHGYHCGYVSPIPFIEYNNKLSEEDFHTFIEAISNDILNWENVQAVMKNGGVTYADTKVLTSNDAVEVVEKNGAKFISGANLCINLREPKRVSPFYNPPGARGEDTFLSTCLTDKTVLHVPCYTFHNGFSTYNHLLEGVLPTKLKFIAADNELVNTRFYKACVGWIRYKPLMLYITHREDYEEKIEEVRRGLIEVLPQMCDYFDNPDYMTILDELNKYDKNVKKHYEEFTETKKSWQIIMEYFS